MKIRKARESDFDAVSSLYAEFNSATKGGHASGTFEHFKGVINHPGTVLLVAEINDEIAATAVLHIMPNMTYGGRPYAFIENVITAASARRNGIGKRLIETALERAWAADTYKVMLLTGKNRPGGNVTSFYEKCGFSADEKIGMIARRDD